MSNVPIIVDLSDYTDYLVAELADPTQATSAQFSSLTEDDQIRALVGAFWEARLDGVLQGYVCDENGVVTAISSTNFPASPSQPLQNNQNMNWSADGQARELVQLVVLYASFRYLRNMMLNIRSAFSAAAGPVRFEYQQSAQVLSAIMKDMMNRRNMILARLSDLGTTPVSVIDSIIARDASLMDQVTYWVSSGDMDPFVYGNGPKGWS